MRDLGRGRGFPRDRGAHSLFRSLPKVGTGFCRGLSVFLSGKFSQIVLKFVSQVICNLKNLGRSHFYRVSCSPGV